MIIFEGYLGNDFIFGVPIVITDDAFLPIQQTYVNYKRKNLFISTLQKRESLYPIFTIIKDLRVKLPQLLVCCPAKMCDGFHTARDRVMCPSLLEETNPSRALKIQMFSAERNLKAVIISKSLANVFVDAKVIEVSVSRF